jgi:hypothetical protein
VIAAAFNRTLRASSVAALVFVVALAPAAPAEATYQYGCVKLKGAARALVDQKRLCNNIRGHLNKNFQNAASGTPSKSRRPHKLIKSKATRDGHPIAEPLRRNLDRGIAPRHRYRAAGRSQGHVYAGPRVEELARQRSHEHGPASSRGAVPSRRGPSRSQARHRNTPVAGAPVGPARRGNSPETRRTPAPQVDSFAGQLAGNALPTPTGSSITLVLVLLLMVAAQRLLRRPALSAALQHLTRSPVTSAPAPPDSPPKSRTVRRAAAVAAELTRPSGLGVIGPGANGYVRALLVELLTGPDPVNVVITWNELNRLFDGEFDHSLLAALSPRLRVTDLLEDAVEYLELEVFIGDAERANPDILTRASTHRPWMYWIATPGQDDDVVLPLIRREPRLLGVMFGEWRHGRTCTIGADGVLAETGSGTPDDGLLVATLTRGEALSRLHASATASTGER